MQLDIGAFVRNDQPPLYPIHLHGTEKLEPIHAKYEIILAKR